MGPSEAASLGTLGTIGCMNVQYDTVESIAILSPGAVKTGPASKGIQTRACKIGQHHLINKLNPYDRSCITMPYLSLRRSTDEPLVVITESQSGHMVPVDAQAEIPRRGCLQGCPGQVIHGIQDNTQALG